MAKMKTEYHFLKGKLKWVRTQTPDPWGNWKCTLYPTPESMADFWKLKERGLKNNVGKDEDGEYVTFKRPTQKNMRGKMVGFTQPEVLNPDGTPLRDMLVGNGSDGTVKLEVYEYNAPAGGGKGIAARLAAIRIDNLVPFELSRDFEEGGDQERMTRGLMEQPKPLF